MKVRNPPHWKGALRCTSRWRISNILCSASVLCYSRRGDEIVDGTVRTRMDLFHGKKFVFLRSIRGRRSIDRSFVRSFVRSIDLSIYLSIYLGRCTNPA
mgnify:CR=1 FL=1